MRTRYIVMMAAGMLILAAVLVYKIGEEIVISKDISRVGRKDSGCKTGTDTENSGRIRKLFTV